MCQRAALHAQIQPEQAVPGGKNCLFCQRGCANKTKVALSGIETVATPPSMNPDVPQSSVSPDAGALRDSEMRLRAILETAVEGIITIDEFGHIESINNAAVKLFGYEPAEVIGQNVSMLMPAPYRQQHDQYLTNYRQTGQARIIGIGREVVGQRKDGSVFPMDLAVSEVLLGSGRIFTGFVRDITARKEFEDQLAQMARRLAEKNRELEAIVFVASHDLRSPLVNIQGFSKELALACDELRSKLDPTEFQALREAGLGQILNEDIPEALSFILSSVAKMDALLAGFLRFSRLGRVTLNIEALDMDALLARVAKTFEFQLKQTGASLQVERLPRCQGDAVQIDQVFSNLIDNALKYAAPGRTPVIKISGREEGNRSVYTVRDNSMGIDVSHQAKIFEIFHRLNPTLASGEGLGLTIALRIIERHDGRIWVDSEAGVGSAFHISLPRISTNS